MHERRLWRHAKLFHKLIARYLFWYQYHRIRHISIQSQLGRNYTNIAWFVYVYVVYLGTQLGSKKSCILCFVLCILTINLFVVSCWTWPPSISKDAATCISRYNHICILSVCGNMIFTKKHNCNYKLPAREKYRTNYCL